MNARLHTRFQARPIASAVMIAGVAFGAFSAPHAQAEDGRVWIAHSYVIRYQHLDFSRLLRRVHLVVSIPGRRVIAVVTS